MKRNKTQDFLNHKDFKVITQANHCGIGNRYTVVNPLGVLGVIRLSCGTKWGPTFDNLSLA